MFYQLGSVKVLELMCTEREKGRKKEERRLRSFFENLEHLEKNMFLYEHPFCGFILPDLFIVIENCLILRKPLGFL